VAVVAASIPEPSRTGPPWGMASPVVYSYAAASGVVASRVY